MGYTQRRLSQNNEYKKESYLLKKICPCGKQT
ncbi:hypothetical protein DFA_00582 [Cavenderia fasciculata]|uniref:Uncharacterized protein n=1 Tax=Cavenderia fasciculata TaxID=261658 RepID=F4PSM7_CACFS|nr:uncharacterized protein DFA_00582 [Cavenderia fasciculata]EGG20719.1 hypothetical protein DFA_00582 [Cavenderia fasciculata]|eukprot:XP_004358569.1 hypothetical protein DFA_00582 [Cavenderia fasciculata]